MTRNNNTKYVLITDDMNGMGLFRRGDVFVKHFYAFSGDVAHKHYAEKQQIQDAQVIGIYPIHLVCDDDISE